jgi:polyhydroxyalkanoate synthase
MATATREPDPAVASAPGGLDTMLTEAARGGGPVRSLFPGTSAVKLAARLALRPQVPVRHTASLAAEVARIAVGRSEVAPAKGDRRFKDPAWQGNPVLRRLMQTYLATYSTVDQGIVDAGLDWRAERRVRFAADNLLDALAPSNSPILNPEALKAALDTGGRNYVRGARALVRDMARPPRVPQMVDERPFAVGENLAVSPGAVVLRTPVFELLQYEPQTPQVREVPLLVTPPMINKFYVTDLAPGRSMIEHLVSNGQQVFAISWRNPDERHADWGLDAYAGAVVRALEAVEEITGADRAHVLGLCAGGITASCAVSHLAATGRLDRVAGLTLGVTVIDQERAGTTGAFVDRNVARAAIQDSARRGYLDGRSLAGVFAWLRPNDLIWNYWVNNYLLGKDPPPFDVLYWNADTTNLPAALHRDFIELAVNNSLVYPGEATVLGTPVDLSKVTVDTYLVAGIADHITPWQNAYRTVRLLGSEPRFVLSTSGHIAALVNPPGNPKARFQINDELPEDPDAFLAGATTKQGSWWGDWDAWLGERSGEQRPAPAELGGGGHRPLGRAPGTYVLQ